MRRATMPYVELACVLLLALGVVLRARAPNFRDWVRDAPIVFIAAWVGEDSAIRVHDFYRYDSAWHGFVDVTPLLIPAIWVFVVLSARDIARIVAPKHLIAAGYVLILFDAFFIEPICTYAGLWKWNAPGPFNVPLIGTFGWMFFGGSLLFCLETLTGRARWLSILLAPLMMHALLVTAWWGALKWLPARGTDLGLTICCWVACLAIVSQLIRRKRTCSVQLSFILPRLGPAAFFFALLTAYRAPFVLWCFAFAFVFPWIALTSWRPAAQPSVPKFSR